MQHIIDYSSYFKSKHQSNALKLLLRFWCATTVFHALMPVARLVGVEVEHFELSVILQ